MKIIVDVAADKAMRAQLLRIGKAANRALAKTAEDAEDYIESQAASHNRHGALVRSIYKRRIEGGWELGHDLQHAPHALFVHWGARAHVIRPKNKKVLRWPAGPAFRFASIVHHPGYKGDAWMPRAAAMAPRIFNQHLAALLKQMEES